MSIRISSHTLVILLAIPLICWIVIFGIRDAERNVYGPCWSIARNGRYESGHWYSLEKPVLRDGMFTFTTLDGVEVTAGGNVDVVQAECVVGRR